MVGFEVTEEHLKLVRALRFYLNDTWLGVPQIDPKRPYGNSEILRDVARIIGLDVSIDDTGDVRLSSEQSSRCQRLHREMRTVLQILVVNCGIEVATYEQTDVRDEGSWRKTR